MVYTPSLSCGPSHVKGNHVAWLSKLNSVLITPEKSSVAVKLIIRSLYQPFNPVGGEAVVTGLITVKRADGSTVAARTSGLQPSNKARLRAAFSRNLPSGRYTVSWRARADDGHSERGTFRFRVR